MAATDNDPTIRRPGTADAAAAPMPLPSVSLGREHITEAFKKSPDGGETLDLTHKNLTDVGEDGAEELASVGRTDDMVDESTVVRIALAYNRLATLPMAFALLTRLRYLVLKNNNFTIFPDVLTIMPSLEILDISRNKIKRLPSQPGSLTKLRVFSLSRNKLHRLPAYFSQFQNLNIFRVDQNPLEWPPREVMEPPAQGSSADAMRGWIRNIQKWIEHDSTAATRKHNEDILGNESSFVDMDTDLAADETKDSTADARSPFDTSLFIEGSSASHRRSFSLESDQSTYSDNVLPLPVFQPTRAPRSPRPPRLHLDAVSTSRSAPTSASPHRSPDSYLPTPEESVSSTDDDTTRSTAQTHGRNASFAGSGGTARAVVMSKKSMPDLRPPKLHLHGHKDSFLYTVNEKSGIPSPPHRQESDSSNGSTQHFRSTKFSQSVVSSPVALHRPAPHMDSEKHQYFRRMSSLNLGSLSKTIPPALLKLVDAIRGILFGVSQIYQALQHYTEYAIDERLSAVLLKVLDPASTYMNQLIYALDRFDTTSKRTVPSPAICRAVVEICRDNVIVFGKAVGVLTLQLKVLATHDDVRYTRQMLLMLYGAMAEIAGAWTAIAGQVEAIKPLLREHGPPPATKVFPIPPSTNELGTPLTAGSVTPTPAFPKSRTTVRSPSGGTSDARARMARRHAGSFSYKDVELGGLLPSNLDSPPLSSGVVGGPTSSTPVPRTIRRAATALTLSNHDTSHSNGGTIRPSIPFRGDIHSRQSSASSLLASTISSPAIAAAKSPSLEALSTTNTMMDGVAVDSIRKAVEAAPSVWKLTEELLCEDATLREALNDTLNKAKDVTGRLRDDINYVGFDQANRLALRDDARVFANTVIQLLNAIKAHGATHPLSPDLRSNMVKLTHATQDFVMLLHVSSFSPVPTPRPYSPMVATLNPMPPSQDDGKLGANLSRSRSAAASPAARVIPPMKEPPRSALPHGTFMSSSMRSQAVPS
ncbi:hypothetical protein BDW22DRAFT_1420865 [Trametopsis cervina]|nr:hypothetical protein BDW22DRAFT_1420865 [Trametopsis cervina]